MNGGISNHAFRFFWLPCCVILLDAGSILIAYPLSLPLQAQLQQFGRVDSVLSERQYFAGLEAASERVFIDEFETEFLLVLDSQQRSAYDALATVAARKAFIAQYWRASNPNPVLPENIWLIEFLQRCAYARANFSYSKPPYFDDRGKYYVKYGRPALRYEESGTPEVFPNESWSYENVMRNFLVHFVKQDAFFREVEDLTDILLNRKPLTSDSRAMTWARLAQQRAAVSPVLGRAAARLQLLQTEQWHAAAFPSSRTVLTEESQKPSAIMLRVAEEAKGEITQAKNERPAVAHAEIKALNKLEFASDLAQFRDPHGATRMEIALLAPLKKNLLNRVSVESTEVLRLEYRCLLRDGEQLTPITRDSMAADISAHFAARGNLPCAVGRLALTALPQPGELALQVRDLRLGKIGFVRSPVRIRDFSGSKLMLSDIQLLFEITSEDQKQWLPSVIKQGRTVTSYPFDRIHRKYPLLVYFEAYNLQTAGITGDCEVTYKIMAGKSRQKLPAQESQAPTDAKNIISVSYSLQVSADQAEELIAIDLSDVAKGEYWLEVAIASMQNKNIMARTQKQIDIVDE